MARLNQLLAVSKSTKAATTRSVTDAHHLASKVPVLTGISRTYLPKDDEGERLPGESTRVQTTHAAILGAVRADMTRLFDVVATVDATNCEAKADVVVDGATILAQVPVTTLLFLEKQLTDWYTILDKLPTLDPAEHWTPSDTAGVGVYASDPVGTVRSKKIPRNHVKAEATEKHPAQVDVYTEDVTVGTWTTVKFSGMLPATRVRALKDRATTLRDAVKYAREAANDHQAVDTTIGAPLFDYLLG